MKNPNIDSGNPVKIGISACLLGKRVRYDGKDSLDPYIVNTIGRYVTFVPVCPEYEAGFGIPRQPMILYGDVERPRLLIKKTQEDVTEKLHSWALKKIKVLKDERLMGYIFKSKSPSCGKHGVKVYDGRGHVVRRGAGIFKSIFQNSLPLIPVVDEQEFHNSGIRDDFFISVFLIKRWYQTCDGRKGLKAIRSFHKENRLILFSKSPGTLREMDALIHRHKSFSKGHREYVELLSRIIGMRSTMARHVKIMKKIIRSLTNSLSERERELIQESIEHYRRGIIPFLMVLTLINHYSKKYQREDLLKECYINPNPLELILRNHA